MTNTRAFVSLILSICLSRRVELLAFKSLMFNGKEKHSAIVYQKAEKKEHFDFYGKALIILPTESAA